MKGLQCYEIFGGIALKNHAFSFSYEHSMGDVKPWTTNNMLKLNDNKTERTVVTSNSIKQLHSTPTSIIIAKA